MSDIFTVSSPYRYAKNTEDVIEGIDEAGVSSPYRYAKNSKGESE